MAGTGRTGGVTRSTLRQQIADALRDEVLGGRLQPGQEFTVKEIAEQYGVSATPVREALVDLSAQGLLDADQHRGFRVHEYSAADYRGMIEARGLVTEGMFQALVAGGLRQFDDPRAVALLAGVRRRGEEAQRAASASPGSAPSSTCATSRTSRATCGRPTRSSWTPSPAATPGRRGRS